MWKGWTCLLFYPQGRQGVCTTSFLGQKVLAASRGPTDSQRSDYIDQIDANNLTQEGRQRLPPQRKAATFYWGRSTCQAPGQTLYIHYFM